MSDDQKQIEEMARVLCNHCAGKEPPCTIAKSGAMCMAIQREAEALYNDDSEYSTNDALPYGSVGTKVKAKDKACNDCGEIENRLFLLRNNIEEELGNNRRNNAGHYYEKRTDSEDNHTCNECGKKGDDNVEHYRGGILLSTNVRSGGNYKLIHFMSLPP